MKRTHWFNTSVIIAGMLTLTACSSMHSSKSSGNTQTAKIGKAANAETYAMKGQGKYDGTTRYSKNGEFMNPLSAPSNQTYYFDFDKSTVGKQFYDAILVQANYLMAHPNARIRLEGNTDNRGSREYNIGLGWRRDQAISELLKQQGVSSEQIDMVSYGKERPAVLSNNENAWHLNRRVNLIYEAY